ncbi:chemotaxis protein CheC [Clostridium sp. KNHs214]|uniref:chemotaxis protein CheC n=1 Tax=Clostridium sp. KNHs214 TaxID=1540257 RepID=UPI00055353AE|nr:chemotaxis protein CheC [Clostridium sp. KNHs214]
MSYLDLNDLQLDALKEIVNIGTGNAATALAQLLNIKVNMSVPSINVIPFDEIFNDIGGEEVVIGVLVRVLGDAPGNILFVMEKDVAMKIINKLLDRNEKEISEMGNSVLCEIGNIMCSAYMNSIAKFTNLVIMPSVPAVTYDMLGAILSTTFIESGQFNEYVLDIETLFSQNDEMINGHFYYIPMPGSLEKILNSIGIK